MNFKIFFSPIPENAVYDISDQGSFYKNIHVFTSEQPDPVAHNIAIIGLPDEKDQETAENYFAANAIRAKLYRLKKGFGKYRISDLGNLRPGVDLAETNLRLKEVCQALLARDVLPIIIGGNHHYTYGQYTAYEALEKLVSVVCVDARLDISEEKKELGADNHIHKMFMHEPNFLFNFCLLAYQSYLIDSDMLKMLEKLYFEAHRLGHLRQNLSEMEPVIREADMLSFDISAIKSSDAPGAFRGLPFGLTGEEACQICWYSGINEKLSSAGFYGYDLTSDDPQQKTAFVIATMIWYFIEGFYHRKDESNFRGHDYFKYVVYMPAEPATLNFYKSKLTDKWWMEVPYPSGKFMYERNLIVPCSFSDYQIAQKGEIPERWIYTQNKLL
ncbi:MAG: formimidoylglutamase [Cyclobacteriaceae bacterium]|nr:formimidoylglutamase [Cyclobacteriaceae bacterium]